MQYYPILQPEKDFRFTKVPAITKGRREKRSAEIFITNSQPAAAFFKYQADGYVTTELVSEKISSELARVLKYHCAEINFAVDENGTPGIISRLFTEGPIIQHTDAVNILQDRPDEEQRDFYFYDRIRAKLDSINETLFAELIPILFFDALVGEGDRHEENWGISLYMITKATPSGNITTLERHISPLYDTGACLLREFANSKTAQKYYDDPSLLSRYIQRGKAMMRDNNGQKFKHFKLMEFLNDEFHDIIKLNIDKLKRELSDEVINNIVDRVPEEMLTTQHRTFIKKYIKERRDILIGMEK